MSKDGVNRTKKPWPTKDVMEQIYKKNLWGGNQSDFYSGAGSHDLELLDPYIDVVASFLTSFETPLVVCDLGCGDFNVGKKLVQHTQQYIAVDIVESLIERNNEKFHHEKLEFQCMDIAEDELPEGDCALIRNVLQHLSNKEVQNIVEKLKGFKYIILTEHVPEDEFTPNKDIVSGQGIRLKKQSGVNLLVPPFNLKIKNEKQLLSVKPKEYEGSIVTTLYTMF